MICRLEQNVTEEREEEYFENIAKRVIAPALAAVANDDLPPDELRQRLDRAFGETYRIERELGGGGMSRVFLATELRLGRTVVIKVLPAELALGVSVERFRREIQLSARLQHPHIVPVLNTDAADGLLYYTMPYVAGETLRSRIAREGPLPISDALDIWRDVLDALAYAHSSGVVHRDIKPENILLGGRNAMVADFGIARAIEAAADDPNVTASGVTLGTPSYMAPEQVAGEEAIDHRIDIYAAGLVMYEMLAGKAPFSGLAARQLLLAHLTQQPPQLSRPDVPAILHAVVFRCLAKDPHERPPTAESILEEIKQTETQRGQSRKRPRIIWAAAAAAVILLVAVEMGRSTSRKSSSMVGEASASADLRSTDRRPSLVVLPLEVLTADSVSEFLADMLTAALIDKFTETGDLRVVQGPSSFFFKRHRASPRAIADSLHVGHVLTGAVHTEGGAVRVLLRLISGTDESILWTQTYKGHRENMFALEDTIESSVAKQLRPSLVQTSRSPRAKPDAAAYELYRRARYEQDFRERAGTVRNSITILSQAVARDSTFAEAYAALAESYALIATGNVSDFPYRVAVDSARYFAERAISLDASLPEAYESRGFLRMLEFDWAGADADSKRAVALNPYYSRRLLVLAALYQWRGDFKKAVTEMRLDLAADPMSPNTRGELARSLFMNGQVEAAVAHLDTMNSLTQGRPQPRSYLTLGEISLSRSRFAEALLNFQRLLEASPQSPAPRAFLAFAYARAGDSTRATQQLNDLLNRWRAGRSSALYVAIAYAGLHDYDNAFAWLDKSYQDHSLRPLLMAPTFSELRKDPRFDLLMRRIGLRT